MSLLNFAVLQKILIHCGFEDITPKRSGDKVYKRKYKKPTIKFDGLNLIIENHGVVNLSINQFIAYIAYLSLSNNYKKKIEGSKFELDKIIGKMKSGDEDFQEEEYLALKKSFEEIQLKYIEFNSE